MKNWFQAVLSRIRFLQAQLRSIKDEASKLMESHPDRGSAERSAKTQAAECWKRGRVRDWIFWQNVAAEIASRAKSQTTENSHLQSKQ